MKRLSFLLLCLGVLGCKSVQPDNFPAGTYVRTGPDGTETGELLIYPEPGSTALLHLSARRGAPSYNSGSIYARVNKNSKKITLQESGDYLDCELLMELEDDTITISTLKDECGFGYGVRADGAYKIKNRDIPQFFTNGEGTEIYFSETPPGDY
ncbi:hypothetical protein [Zeaxanthinibacter enoshimensis]|uniref:Lipoprotein n=1 Tax=Zeaxanthinibacter enoshimensis TaxID=392009 RepID=A0A4R6TPR1_9FLAO|nr:hypothetical protein [Zeaxanthinibacter enoshimensis]TDQ33130.1 hypothetical protein CLV82_0968 [Zeaxanthinibacter enoshimensis]